MGIVILLFSVYTYFFAVRKFKTPPLNVTGDPGAKLFPTFALILMGIGAVGLIFQKKPEGKPFMQKDEYKRLALLAGSFVVYAAALYLLGFIPATLIMLFVVMSFMAGNARLSLAVRVLYSNIVTAVLFFVFTYVLHFVLPRGLLFSNFV